MLEFIAHLTEILAWPLAFLVVVIVFTRSARRGRRTHACTSPCVGGPNHYGPCCCDYAHTWEDRNHGMRAP